MNTVDKMFALYKIKKGTKRLVGITSCRHTLHDWEALGSNYAVDTVPVFSSDKEFNKPYEG